MTFEEIRELCDCSECTVCGLVQDTEDCGQSHDAHICDLHTPEEKR